MARFYLKRAALLAYHYHFDALEVMNMDTDDYDFWFDELVDIKERESEAYENGK